MPSKESSSSSSFAAGKSISVIAIFAPAFPKATAAILPIPLAEPVIIAVLFFSLNKSKISNSFAKGILKPVSLSIFIFILLSSKIYRT